MPFDPIYAGVVTIFLLLLIILLLVSRIRHRILTGREMLHLIGQSQYEYILIDIRSSREYETGHILNAQNVPFPECPGYMPTENMFEKIFVYGQSRRSARIVAKMLDETGYFNVTFYGAFRGWRGPVTIIRADNEEQS